MITDINLEEETCAYARLLTKEIEEMGDSSADEMDEPFSSSQQPNASLDDLFPMNATSDSLMETL